MRDNGAAGTHRAVTSGMATTLITGNTFPVKDQLRALGGRWDAVSKGWWVPAEKADEARALVAGPAVARDAARSAVLWRRCGYTTRRDVDRLW